MNDFSFLTSPTDPVWLEELDGKDALSWVSDQNTRTVDRYCAGDDFHTVKAQVLRELGVDSRIPWVSRYGDDLYNFWQDVAQPRGVWRKTTAQEYRKDNPKWETVLDIDELASKEGIDWVFKGFMPLPPENKIGLLYLSPNGGDACAVREFDLVTQGFVVEGFNLPVSKSSVAWIDANTLFFGDVLDPECATASGYPRTVKRWRRATPFSSGETVFEGNQNDVSVFAYREHAPGFERDVIVRSISGAERELYLLSGEAGLIKVEVPVSAEFQLFREFLLIKATKPWTLAGLDHEPGTLLAVLLDDYLVGRADPFVLFKPTPHRALQSFQRVGDVLVLNVLENVKNTLLTYRFIDGQWVHSQMVGVGEFNTLTVGRVDMVSRDYVLSQAGFLEPPSLSFGSFDGDQLPEKIKVSTSPWPLDNYKVAQHFATSRDGTKIPYFEVSRRDVLLNGENPTLLYGYGGFQISLRPSYLGVEVPGWLERGGVYVVANIRGGGEFGPTWHQAALRENRSRAYEDFAAVAQDLVARGVTSPDKLGARGGSNGGLLVGNMLTHYPHLFGCLVIDVPLLDMRRYSSLLAGASWISEFGDPDREEDWAFLKKHSPYHNIRADWNYPPTLLLTSSSDDRVSPAHARKMAYRMQDAGYDQVYFYESLGGGHSGSVDHEKAARQCALVSEFLWRHLNQDQAPE